MSDRQKQTPAESAVALLCMTAVVLWCLNGHALLGVSENVVVSTIVSIFGSMALLMAGDKTLVAMRKSRK
jgi:hypothetical protein